MEEVYSDHKLQRALRQYLYHTHQGDKFKAIYYCGSRVIHQPGVQPRVYIIANDTNSREFGTIHCKSSWACPVCTPRNMSRYAAEIAVAIDALKEWEHQVACMITFTIPHTRGMSCKESTEILYESWKDFTVHGNKNQNAKYYSRKTKQMIVSNKKLTDPFASFCEEFHCKHRVRVCEYTHGEAGWHPHFHCLFWVDQSKLQSVIDWQEKLCNRWLELVKRKTLKLWNKLYPDKNNKLRLDIMYSRLNRVSQAVYISTDQDGKVIEQKSSQYICGWGADRELTGNVGGKATHDGHQTPFQILEEAAKTGDIDKYELFMEYVRTTYRHARINYSVHSGIKKIIAKWKLTNKYYEFLKKKFTAEAAKQGKWKIICWFSESQWLQICLLDRMFNIRSKILELALTANPRQQIQEFLYEYDIDIGQNVNTHIESFLENHILNQPYKDTIIRVAS